MPEKHCHDALSALFLRSDRVAVIDAIEQKAPQFVRRRAYLRLHRDIRLFFIEKPFGVPDDARHHRVYSRRVVAAEGFSEPFRNVALREYPGAAGVVYVVVYIRYAVGELHDPTLER